MAVMIAADCARFNQFGQLVVFYMDLSNHSNDKNIVAAVFAALFTREIRDATGAAEDQPIWLNY